MCVDVNTRNEALTGQDAWQYFDVYESPNSGRAYDKSLNVPF